MQELVQVTKQRMIDAVKEKIRRLHEEKIISELTKGIYNFMYIQYRYIPSSGFKG